MKLNIKHGRMWKRRATNIAKVENNPSHNRPKQKTPQQTSKMPQKSTMEGSSGKLSWHSLRGERRGGENGKLQMRMPVENTKPLWKQTQKIRCKKGKATQKSRAE